MLFGEGVQIVNISGTSTAGTALLVYLGTWKLDAKRHRDTQAALRELIRTADHLAGVRACTGRKTPSWIV